jgi:hypothetical protein
MPTLSESLGTDTSGYTPAETTSPGASSPSTNLQPGYSPYIRCPIPPIWQSSPDSLRFFYSGGSVPQTRLFNPSGS